MGIQLHDVRGGPTRLDPDTRRGFRTAVTNNQPRLALEYAVNIIEELDNKISGLTKEVVALKASKPEESKPSTRKATPKVEQVQE